MSPARTFSQHGFMSMGCVRVCVHACARVCCIRCARQQARSRVNYPGNIGKIQNGGKNPQKTSQREKEINSNTTKNFRKKKKKRERRKENSERKMGPSPLSLSSLPPRHMFCPSDTACPAPMCSPGGWEGDKLGVGARTPGCEGALVSGGLAGAQDWEDGMSMHFWEWALGSHH